MASWKSFFLLLPMLLLAVGLTSCVAPALDRDDYLHKASKSAEEAASAVEVARLAVETAVRHGLFTPPIEVSVAEAEEAISSISSNFGSVTPPSDEEDEIRRELMKLLEEAEDQLSAARIAVQRNDLSTAAKELEGSPDLAEKLHSLSKALEPK